MKKSILILCALGMAGCTSDAGAALVIKVAASPTANCSYMASDDSALGAGFVDTSLSAGYFMAPVMENLTQTANGDPQEKIRRSAFLKRVNVSLAFPSDFFSDSELDALSDDIQFSIPVSGLVDPDGGQAVIPVEVVPEDVLDAMDLKLSGEEEVLIRANVSVVAEIGGNDRQSSEISFPITACSGCLYQSLGTCGDANLPPGFQADEVCVPGQEKVLQCCTQGAVEVCPCYCPMTM